MRQEDEDRPGRLERLLRFMREHPAAYLGARERSFTAMMGFIEGFQTAKVAGDGLDWDAFAPRGFGEYVLSKLKSGSVASPRAWPEELRKVTNGEEEALALYFDLRIQFLLERPTNDGDQ